MGIGWEFVAIDRQQALITYLAICSKENVLEYSYADNSPQTYLVKEVEK